MGEQKLTPNGWCPNVSRKELAGANRWRQDGPYEFVAVLERDTEFGEEHGARRFAVLFLGVDGIASYDALFCQDATRQAPYAVLLQDHGSGDNSDRFFTGGLLERIARSTRVLPTWLLVGENTKAWEGFARVKGVLGD